MKFALRTSGNPETLMASAQREIWRIELAAIVDEVKTMSQRIDDTLSPRRPWLGDGDEPLTGETAIRSGPDRSAHDHGSGDAARRCRHARMLASC